MTHPPFAMVADRTRINYAKAVLTRKFSGEAKTSGTLTSGSVYFIARFESPDDFENVGARANAQGVIFTATGTTPTKWTGGSRLIPFDLAELKRYAMEVYGTATDTVTITSGNFEGGGGSGEITFEKVLLGLAVEELIAEFDPDYVKPSSAPRGRPMGITVRL